MDEQHLNDEEIKKFVSTERPLDGKGWEEFLQLASKIQTHMRDCPECLDKVREAQKAYDEEKGIFEENYEVDEIEELLIKGRNANRKMINDQIKKEISEIDETLEYSDGDYSRFELADDIKNISNSKVRVAVMLHYADRLFGIPAVTDYIASQATEEEKKKILEVFKREGIHINPNIFPTPFKDTIMGKMTKGAVMVWGENNENGEWFAPTEEQAETIISEGGLKLGETTTIDYSTSEKATNGKTYGSEIAAIEGLVDLVANYEELSQEEKTILIEEMKKEVYTKTNLSPELALRIVLAMEEKGIETSTIEVLGTIHDNWVKSNGNKFDDPKRAKKLYQFTDLRLMSYGGDGATADLLFLQPILEGAGIELDVDGELKAEFEKQQKEYMAEHGIKDSKGLRDYLSNIEENYPTIKGVTTSKGKTLEQPVEIANELKDSEILERMTEQVSGKIGINYEKEQHDASTSIKGKTIGIPEMAKADMEANVKESDLMPIKKKGFKEWIKGLVDKLMGKGEK